ncbi:hypothetical protein HBN50_07975 [Halobacteriovorax sp. GB3]|uniref:hypothetical protein n=1 Tax=Halobacteriovorax sp. GB3 TaxID=2719615 RepID=UPI00235E6F3C|nr:hypothetical protein [Halobacteriovorax sp. GB3]MDD0853030.1 hypothetical protein [Halobacteriovorax sp. GB3]
MGSLLKKNEMITVEDITDSERDSWIEEIASICESYGKFLALDPMLVFEALESKRTFWYPNYYHKANFPDLEGVFKARDINDLLKKIDISQGFRCPFCKAVSKSPYKCDSGIEVERGGGIIKCNWKSYGLFNTLGRGLRIMLTDNFLNNPFVDEIFYPVSLETNNARPNQFPGKIDAQRAKTIILNGLFRNRSPKTLK